MRTERVGIAPAQLVRMIKSEARNAHPTVQHDWNER